MQHTCLEHALVDGRELLFTQSRNLVLLYTGLCCALLHMGNVGS